MDMAALAANPSLQYGTVVYPMHPKLVSFTVVNSIVEVVVVAIIVARCLSRRIQGTRLGAEDHLCFAAAFLSFFTLICQSLMARWGSGYPVSKVMSNLATQLLLTFIMQPFYIFSVMCSKLSVCCIYLRIFGIKQTMRLATLITMVIVVLWAVSHYLAGVFSCKPVSAQWDLVVAARGATCIHQVPLWQSLHVFNALTDLMIMALPIHTIWSLKMRRSEKIGLCSSFMVGILLVAAAIVRIVYLAVVDIRGNLTGTMPISIFLGVLDTQLAVISVTIPVLRPLWMRVRGIRSVNDSAGSRGAYALSAERNTNNKNDNNSNSRSANANRSARSGHDDLELTIMDNDDEGGVRGGANNASGDAGSVTSEGSELGLREKDVHRISVRKQYSVAHD